MAIAKQSGNWSVEIFVFSALTPSFTSTLWPYRIWKRKSRGLFLFGSLARLYPIGL
jgi:hypothetical protein